MMIGDNINSIKDIQNVDGVYEIHPCGDNTISGYIKSTDGKLIDFSNGNEYTDYEISQIETFEETGNVYYRKIL